MLSDYCSSDSDEGLDRSVNQDYMSKKTYFFSDMVHSHLELPVLCNKLINTPQFHRLKNLKQLGLCYFVYPSASHNRFEHCIGTSYLAGKYGKFLQKNQPELNITERDILCLYIAGLLHDVGHGPFSHTWEHFMHNYDPTYSHENISIRMIDEMIEKNALWEYFENENLEKIDITFIKELILGHPLPGSDELKGRGDEKFFLYQIVSNEETKIDVDKFDYLLRDGKQLNANTAFDYERVLNNCRVIPVKVGERSMMKIAYRKKIFETGELEDLFKGRFKLHQIAYQHHSVKIVEDMVLDGLKAAEPHFVVSSENGKEYKLSTAHQDLSAFMKLTDSIFEMFLNWNAGGEEAKRIFGNIVKRDLYKSIGYLAAPPEEKAMVEFKELSPNLYMIKTKIDYGMGDANPLSNALFFEKNRQNQIIRLEFPPPKLEAKCYIVYRPMIDQKFILASDLGFEDAKKEVYRWAKIHELCIQDE